MSTSYQLFSQPIENNNIENQQWKHRPLAEKRSRGNDYSMVQQQQQQFQFQQQNQSENMNLNRFTNTRNYSLNNNNAYINNNQSNNINQSQQYLNNSKKLNQTHANNTISMMSNRGFTIANSLRGYTKSQQQQQQQQQQNSFYPDYNINNNGLLINQNDYSSSPDTLPIIQQHQSIGNGVSQIINPANFNYRLSDGQELQRRERIKEQNLQEKMIAVQKEQKVNSEVAYSFKQMSTLLDACLKLDETGSGLTAIKSNDLYLPHGCHFVQYKAIEFPKCIIQYYTEQYERSHSDISVNKGIISELSLAWVSINSKLFMWKYGPQSFTSFNRMKDKNEYYKQKKDEYGTKRDEKIEREEVKEFELEDTILYITYGQPKHAIFQQNCIKNVLLIAFPHSIKVKHIRLEHNNLDIQDINVTINTDHELVTKIVFSKKGRIFYGGSSGRVKYIDYFKQELLGFTISEKFSAKEGMRWQEKWKQQLPLFNQNQTVIDISVDDTRQILYALIDISQQSSFFKNPFSYSSAATKNVQRIDVYDLGAYDEDFKFIGSLDHAKFCDQLLSSKSNHFHLLPTSKELSIVSVSAVEKYQANDYHFVIVTQSGIRAYYSLNTSPLTNKKKQVLTAQETKEAREKYQLFEKYRPLPEFTLKHIKGMVDVSQQNTPFKNFHIFYDHKDYMTNKGVCVQVDDDQKKQIKYAYSLRGGMVMQKIENNQNRLLFIETNPCFIARQKENMFNNHQIFSEFHSNYSVASERIGEIILDFQNRDENPHVLSDLTLAQIPEKNLVNSAVSGLIQQFDQLETSQMIGETSGQQSMMCLNDLVRQTFSAPSHYVILTSKGILLNYLQRPIDILHHLIKVLPDYITEPNQSQAQIQYLIMTNHKVNRVVGNQINEFKNTLMSKQTCFEFFEQFILTYGVTETFAMLSQMLCHSHLEYYQNLNVHNHLDKQLKSRLTESPLNNTNTFLQGTIYEGSFKSQKPTDKPNDLSSIPETIVTEISESVLKKTHFLFQKYGNILLDETSEIDFQNKMMNDVIQNTLGKAWEQQRRKYTSKVEGILLYFSRLIRPIWNKPLVNSYAFKFYVNEPIENFKREEIAYFTRRVNEFKYWLENETKIIYCNELKSTTTLPSESSSINDIYMKNVSTSSNNRFGSQNRYKSNEEKMQEIKSDEAKLIDDLLRFCNKIIQIANLFLFISENKLRSNLNNVEFKDLRDELLNIKFKDIFNDKKHEKTIKSYVLQALKLDPKYMDQARLMLNQFDTVFHERDFNISHAEIKLQKILNKFSKTGKPEAKYLNECTNILLDQIEYLTTDYLERFSQIYNLLDSQVDFVKIVIECIKFHQRIMENLERQIQETQGLEEQLRANQNYNPVNKYSEQLKIQKHILDDNSSARDYCLQKIIQILEALHKDSETDVKNKPAKEAYISNIIKIIQGYPSDLVHAALIEFLMRNKRKDAILELNSPFTEQIFNQFGTESADCLKIKYKYLEQIGNIREAYNVAFQISNFKNNEEMIEECIYLEDRIAFTEIAIYDVNLILSDFNISNEGKQNYQVEKEILQKQLRILKVQKRIHDKLETALNTIEANLKKAKDINKKKQFEELKKKYRESYDILQYLRLDEAMIDNFFIQPLNLLEFQLILYDMSSEEKTDANIKKIYDQIITRMSSNEIFEHNPWPYNCQDTFSMLNEEITNKGKLLNLDHIVVRCEDYNAEMSKSVNFSVKQCLDLYTGLLSERDGTDKKILSSPLWMGHFLVSKLRFSPLYLVSLYSDMSNILKEKVDRQSSLHINHCIFILLRHCINYIADLLLHHLTKTRELFTLRNSIITLQKILHTFSVEGMRMVREYCDNETDVIQYQTQFDKILEELSEQISQVEQLDGDYYQRNDFLSQQQQQQQQQQYQQNNVSGLLIDDSLSKSSGKNNIVFHFDPNPTKPESSQFIKPSINNNNNNVLNKNQNVKTVNYSIPHTSSTHYQANLINQISEAKSEEEEEIILEKRKN